MNRKWINVFVLAYVVFISILTIQMILQKINNTTNNTAPKMIIDLNGECEDKLEKKSYLNPILVSKPRKIQEQVVQRKYKYILTEHDYDVLLRVVEAEAGCEDENGKLLVANVVINRVLSKKFPSTVADVVYQSNGGKIQFSTAYNGRMNSVKVSNETKAAVERAMYGEDISKGAMYFISSKAVSEEKKSWFYGKLTYLFDYGRHSFFK